MSKRTDWDKLPDFIPLHQAIADASVRIKDRSFIIEYDADYTSPHIRLAKGDFTQDLYFSKLDNLISSVGQHYNTGYINYRIATLKATRLVPVPISFVDEIVQKADQEIESIHRRKQEYSQL